LVCLSLSCPDSEVRLRIDCVAFHADSESSGYVLVDLRITHCQRVLGEMGQFAAMAWTEFFVFQNSYQNKPHLLFEIQRTADTITVEKKARPVE